MLCPLEPFSIKRFVSIGKWPFLPNFKLLLLKLQPNKDLQMKSFRFFLIVFLQGGAIVLFAQEESAIKPKKNYIHVNLGLMHTRQIDEGYSKLLFRGTPWKYSLGYGRETIRYQFSASAEASLGGVESKNGNLPSDFYFIQASLEFSRKYKPIQFAGKPSSMLTGLNLSSSNYMIINQPIFDNASVLSLHGAYLVLGCDMNLSKRQRLQFSYRLPTAVYANHLVWNGGAADLYYDDQKHLLRTLTTRGSFTYFDILKNIQFNVGYELSMKGNTCFIVGYKFRYATSSSAPHAAIYSNGLSVGLKIKF
jgi:hypothetical protein